VLGPSPPALCPFLSPTVRTYDAVHISRGRFAQLDLGCPLEWQWRLVAGVGKLLIDVARPRVSIEDQSDRDLLRMLSHGEVPESPARVPGAEEAGIHADPRAGPADQFPYRLGGKGLSGRVKKRVEQPREGVVATTCVRYTSTDAWDAVPSRCACVGPSQSRGDRSESGRGWNERAGFRVARGCWREVEAQQLSWQARRPDLLPRLLVTVLCEATGRVANAGAGQPSQ